MWDGCANGDSDLLENVQNEDGKIVTGQQGRLADIGVCKRLPEKGINTGREIIFLRSRIATVLLFDF